MLDYIPPAIEKQLGRVQPRVDSGELTPVQAGEFLTGLIGLDDYDVITDPRVIEIFDLGSDLELEKDGSYQARYLWRSIETLLDEVLGDLSSQ